MSDIVQYHVDKRLKLKELSRFTSCYFAFQNKLNDYDRSTDFGMWMLDEDLPPTFIDLLIYLLKNEPGLRIKLLYIYDLKFIPHTRMKEFVFCLSWCKTMIIYKSMCTLLEQFFNEFNECYT